jgi:hypothetical protein
MGALPSASTARIAVTATPMPNNLLDLYALLDFVCPGILGDEDYFVEGYLKPIEAGRAEGASEVERCVGDATLAAFREVQDERLLIRTKAATSPDAEASVVSRTYVVTHSLSTVERSLFGALAERSGVAFRGVNDLMDALMHPELLRSRAKTGDLASAHVGAWPESFEERVQLSSKLTLCVNLVGRVVRRDERAVVVTDHKLVTELLAKRLGQLHGKAAVVVCNGDTKRELRAQRVADFNNPKGDARVFLLSKKMPEGISLQAATSLFLLRPDFNPAVDAQALGRIFRRGTAHNCFHYILVGAGGPEELVLERQEGKSSLLEAVRGGGRLLSQMREGGLLFSLDPPEVASRLAARIDAAAAEVAGVGLGDGGDDGEGEGEGGDEGGEGSGVSMYGDPTKWRRLSVEGDVWGTLECPLLEAELYDQHRVVVPDEGGREPPVRIRYVFHRIDGS